MKDQIAKELGLVGLVDRIEIVKIEEGIVDFVINGATYYYAKVNKSGNKILKNSVRMNLS